MTYVKTYLPTLKTHVVNLKRDTKDLSRDLQRLEVRGKLGSKTLYWQINTSGLFSYTRLIQVTVRKVTRSARITLALFSHQKNLTLQASDQSAPAILFSTNSLDS